MFLCAFHSLSIGIDVGAEAHLPIADFDVEVCDDDLRAQLDEEAEDVVEGALVEREEALDAFFGVVQHDAQRVGDVEHLFEHSDLVALQKHLEDVVVALRHQPLEVTVVQDVVYRE